ncbi:HET-domain-containing protein [Stipitochalara longipes BDJ]|nr:HET-domain-containing protein [Stipitochalara longipes BDJ]
MRLLNVRSMQLESFEGDEIPSYAILSHTWGEDEVSFQDIHGAGAALKTGYKKIQLICDHALSRNLKYVWVDTCCIDKTSSAELSEAINSMYRWYQKSVYCYAYLADVPDGTEVYPSTSAFAASRWFLRGWTLQELLAPRIVLFFSTGGQELGSRLALSGIISSITLIGEEYLTGTGTLSQASVAKRMSWCSYRRTTRIEDIAYCLLGIFGINMPLQLRRG